MSNLKRDALTAQWIEVVDQVAIPDRLVPLDATVVRGSHGLAASDPRDRPILIGHGPNPGASVPMTTVKELVLAELGLPA